MQLGERKVLNTNCFQSKFQGWYNK